MELPALCQFRGCQHFHCIFSCTFAHPLQQLLAVVNCFAECSLISQEHFALLVCVLVIELHLCEWPFLILTLFSPLSPILISTQFEKKHQAFGFWVLFRTQKLWTEKHNSTQPTTNWKKKKKPWQGLRLIAHQFVQKLFKYLSYARHCVHLFYCLYSKHLKVFFISDDGTIWGLFS